MTESASLVWKSLDKPNPPARFHLAPLEARSRGRCGLAGEQPWAIRQGGLVNEGGSEVRKRWSGLEWNQVCPKQYAVRGQHRIRSASTNVPASNLRSKSREGVASIAFSWVTHFSLWICWSGRPTGSQWVAFVVPCQQWPFPSLAMPLLIPPVPDPSTIQPPCTHPVCAFGRTCPTEPPALTPTRHSPCPPPMPPGLSERDKRRP